jgi:cytochrome c-type biogenesis protein CcmH
MAANKMIKKIAILFLLCLALPIYADTPLHQFSNEQNRNRFTELTLELRCPKCQNQDLADSNAPIAADLRNQIIAMIEQGKSDQEIIDYMVNRYGEFVLYKPRFSGYNVILWLAPALLISIGVCVILVIVRSNKKITSMPLDDHDKELALQKLLNEKDQA